MTGSRRAHDSPRNHISLVHVCAECVSVAFSFPPVFSNAKAGYGWVRYIVAHDGARREIRARFGQVQTNPRHRLYRGAKRHSNNAGEMNALLRAIEEELPKRGHVTFRVDSTYAINIATGRWAPNKRKVKGSNNRDMAQRLRSAYRQLTASRPEGHVSIVHVRAHTGDHGNERADRLAKLGTDLDPGSDEEDGPDPNSETDAPPTATDAPG